MTTENPGRKLVVYKAVLPAVHSTTHLSWTVDDLRRFVRDADLQGIPGDTKLKRSQGDLAFAPDRYEIYVERIVDLDAQ